MTPPDTEEACLLTFAAFRAGFLTILDRLLLDALDPHASLPCRPGLFDCFPPLNAVASQIQLECLLDTWSRWRRGFPSGKSAVDKCVVYACWEALARICPPDRSRRLQAIARAFPRGNQDFVLDHWLRSRVRCLQVAEHWEEGDTVRWALCPLDESQSSDPSERWHLDPEREQLMTLTGQWAACRQVVLGSEGLLTQDEQGILRAYFEEHPGLVRS